MQPRRIKTASDIKTSLGRIPAGLSPQKLYMRIASLEAKRQRFEREQQTAKQKMAECAERCDRINHEVEALLTEIKTRFPDASLPSAGAVRVIPPKTPSAVRGSSVTHRY
ncbi:MAG: hypothetical protein AAF297_03590 [Planctomycetota bacterium]